MLRSIFLSTFISLVLINCANEAPKFSDAKQQQTRFSLKVEASPEEAAQAQSKASQTADAVGNRENRKSTLEEIQDLIGITSLDNDDALADFLGGAGSSDAEADANSAASDSSDSSASSSSQDSNENQASDAGSSQTGSSSGENSSSSTQDGSSSQADSGQTGSPSPSPSVGSDSPSSGDSDQTSEAPTTPQPSNDSGNSLPSDGGSQSGGDQNSGSTNQDERGDEYRDDDDHSNDDDDEDKDHDDSYGSKPQEKDVSEDKDDDGKDDGIEKAKEHETKICAKALGVKASEITAGIPSKIRAGDILAFRVTGSRNVIQLDLKGSAAVAGICIFTAGSSNRFNANFDMPIGAAVVVAAGNQNHVELNFDKGLGAGISVIVGNNNKVYFNGVSTESRKKVFSLQKGKDSDFRCR